MKNFLIKIAKGIGIGISCMIPGVSGGTFALISKCYDDLVDNISYILIRFIKSFLALLPYAIGILLGLVIAYFGLKLAFNYILFSIICLFTGMIIASVGDIYQNIKGEKLTFKHYLTFIICFLFIIAIAITSLILSLNGYSATDLFKEHPFWLYLVIFVVGVLASFALVAPGVSGAMLLLVIGFYQPILDTLHSIAHFEGDVFANIMLIVIFIIGIIVGMITVSNLARFLLKNYKTITFCGILGLVSASAIAIFLNNDLWYGNTSYVGILANPKELFLGIPLLIIGFILVFLLLRIANKNNEERKNGQF